VKLVKLIPKDNFITILRQVPSSTEFLAVLDGARRFYSCSCLIDYELQSCDIERPAARIIHTLFCTRKGDGEGGVIIQRFYRDVEFNSIGVMEYSRVSVSDPTEESRADARRLWNTLIGCGYGAERCV